MKNLALPLFVFLLSFNAIAQIEWTGNIEFSDWASDILVTSSNEIVLVQRNIWSDEGFSVLDCNGNEVFTYDFNDYLEGYGSSTSEILELPGSGYVFASVNGECDLIVEPMVKFDQQWNIEWIGYSQVYNLGAGAVFSNNDFIFCADTIYSGNEFTKIAADGSTLWINNDFDFKLYDVIVTPGDSVIIVSSGGLLVADGATGEVIDVREDLLFSRIESLVNGNYIVQQGTSLHLLSPLFEYITTFSQPGQGIRDFCLYENQIAVLSTAPHVYLLDQNFQWMDDFPLNGENQIFRTLEFYSGNLLLGGSERFGTAAHGNFSSFVKLYTSDGQTMNTGIDAGIVSMEPGPQPLFMTETSFKKHVFEDIKITVLNHGNSDINQLNLNVQFDNAFVYFDWCPEYQSFTKRFDNLTLMPGSTTELVWEELTVYTNAPHPDTLNLCFWTSLPNQKLDADHTNDFACTDFAVSEKEAINQVDFQVFPNPSSGECQISFQGPAGNFEIFISDPHGHILHKRTISAGKENLKLEELKPGLYFISLCLDGVILHTDKLLRF